MISLLLFIVICIMILTVLIKSAFFLLQVDDTEVISFLLSTEIIPLCLRTMEMGSELSKTVEFVDFITLLYWLS